MEGHVDISDAENVKSTLRGESGSYKFLVARYCGPLHAIAKGYGIDDRENAVQESFFRGYRDLPALKDPDRFGAWIMKICRHICFEAIRRRKKDRDVAMIKEYLKESSEPELSVNGSLESAIEKLEEPYRSVILMRFFTSCEGGDGMRITDIAKAMNCNRHTVGIRLRRALIELHKKLWPTVGEEELEMRGVK